MVSDGKQFARFQHVARWDLPPKFREGMEPVVTTQRHPLFRKTGRFERIEKLDLRPHAALAGTARFDPGRTRVAFSVNLEVLR
jgi:hypothetical protein